MAKLKLLLIAEKPSLMRAVQEAYNNHKNEIPYDITFMAQRGHLCTLKMPNEIDPAQAEWKWENLPFHPEQHGGFQYKVIDEKKQGNNQTSRERYEAIKRELKSGNYDGVCHCGDPDGEGQLLVDIVLKELKNSLPVYRFWSNDLTEGAVVNALKNLRDNDNDPMLVRLTQSAYGRQHSDYRFGMNLSEAASLRMNGRAAIGRVKTPILAIVCQREVDIENFKPSTSYGVRANYIEGFSGQYFVPSTGVKSDDEEEDTDTGMIYFDTKEEADAFIKSLSSPVTVVDYTSKKAESTAPKLFKLATIQIAAGKFGFNPDKTLSVIQSLYEKTYLSYPRTDCEYISSHEDLASLVKSCASVPSLAPFVSKVSADSIAKVNSNKKYVNDKKLESSGHSALIPTKIIPKFESLSEDEKKIYELVCRQFLAIFLPPLVQNKVTLIADTNGNLFKSTGKTLVSRGYTEIFGTTFTDVEIPVHSKGDTIGVNTFDIVEKTTTCPKRFTAPDLVAVCENPQKYLNDKHLKDVVKELKIGTPATRAAIIQQLQEKDHYLEVSKEGKKEYLVPSENGRKIWENLKDCQICRVDMTAEWEEMLEKVREGEMSLENFEKTMITTVEQLINDIKNANMQSLSATSKFPIVGKCPKCGGDICSGAKGFFCSNYKNGCKVGGFKMVLTTKLSDKDFGKLLQGEVIEKKLKKDGKEWTQKLKYNLDECKVEFVKAEVKEAGCKCPKCQSTMTENDKGVFCTDKEGCGFVLWKNFLGHTFTSKEVEDLLSGKPTGKISMRSKAGKSFTASVSYNFDTNKLDMDFS